MLKILIFLIFIFDNKKSFRNSLLLKEIKTYFFENNNEEIFQRNFTKICK